MFSVHPMGKDLCFEFSRWTTFCSLLSDSYIRFLQLHPFSAATSVFCSYIRFLQLHPFSAAISVFCSYIRFLQLHPFSLPVSTRPWSFAFASVCRKSPSLSHHKTATSYHLDFYQAPNDHQTFSHYQKSHTESKLS